MNVPLEISVMKLIKDVSFKGQELKRKLEELKIKRVISVPGDGDCAFWCLFVALSIKGICPESLFKKYLEGNIGKIFCEEIYLDFYHKKFSTLYDIMKILSDKKGKEVIKNLRLMIAECYLEQLLKSFNIDDALEIYNDSKVGDINKSITHDSFEYIIKNCIHIPLISIIPSYNKKNYWQIKREHSANTNNIIMFNSGNHYYFLMS